MQKLKLLFLLCLPLISVSCATAYKPVDTSSLKPEEGMIFGTVRVLDDQGEIYNENCYVNYETAGFFKHKIAKVEENGVFVITAPETGEIQNVSITCGYNPKLEISTNYAYKIKAGEVAYVGSLEFKADVRNNNWFVKFLLVYTFGELLNLNNKRAVQMIMMDNFEKDLELLKDNRKVYTKSPIVKKPYFIHKDQKIVRSF